MNVTSMEQVLDALSHARQRATYGAVAGYVGSSPRTLMKGRDRDQRHSWVVSHKNGLPTGYDAEHVHPELMRSERVIQTKEELGQWLLSQPGFVAPPQLLAGASL